MAFNPIRRVALLASAGGLAGCGAAAHIHASPAAGHWTARASLPWPGQELYCTVAAGRIVVAGGLARRDGELVVVDRSASYDPHTDQWTEGPPLPQARHHLMLVQVAGRVLALGGFAFQPQGQWHSVTDVWVLDGDRWQEAGRLPRPQAESVGLEHGGRVHLIGGRSPRGSANRGWFDHADVATHRVFEPTAAHWAEAAPLPIACNSAAGAVIGDALYLVGGRTTAMVNSDRLFRYRTGTDRWEALAPLPPAAAGRGQGGLAAAALGGRLYAFGGEYFGVFGGGVFPEAWEYDPARDLWRSVAPMRTPRHGHAAAAVGDRIYAIGGSGIESTGRTVATVEAFTR